MTVDKVKNIISVLWSKGLPFAVWSLPKQKEVNILLQTEKAVKEVDFKDMESVEGFIIAPFESAETRKAYVLQPGLFFDSLPEINLVEQLPVHQRSENMVNHLCDKTNYITKAKQVIRDLKNRKLKKLVLSRVIERRFEEEVDPGALFSALNEQYIDTFNYLFYLPETGSWMGATPEMFLKIGTKHAEITSLAGTKLTGNSEWTLKEREEQAIVTEFMTGRLDEKGIRDYEIHGPETITAGKLEHLRTGIVIPVENLQNKTGKLIGYMHPTPAVCGMPQKEAYEYIRKVEDHRRKCYTGFLGPWRLHGRSELYVNLRCAQFDRKIVHLFVGGGLTASSVAESEWEETEHKSKTLLSVIENL